MASASAWVGDVLMANPHPDTPPASSDPAAAAAAAAGSVTRPSAQDTTTTALPNRARIPSLSSTTGRPRGLSTVSSTSSVKRKPLPATAAPLLTKLPSPSPPREQQPEESVIDTTTTTVRLPERPRRFSSDDSPTLYDTPLTARPPPLLPAKAPARQEAERRRKFSTPTTTTTTTSSPSPWPTRKTSIPTDKTSSSASSRSGTLSKTPSSSSTRHTPSESSHVRLVSDSSYSTEASALDPAYEDYHSHLIKEAAASSMPSARPARPHLRLSSDVTPQNHPEEIDYYHHHNNNTTTTTTNRTIPKSPGASKLGSFFGWGGSTSPAPSLTTSDEDKASSPVKSPAFPPAAPRPLPGGIDTSRANAQYDGYLDDPYAHISPGTPATSVQVAEMEQELKTITSELATSIRREMDLEDLVERLQAEAAYPQGPGKRTSDYFSDAGTSSVKYGGEPDARADELERLHRRNEREKAQIRLELGEKVQDERRRRKGLEAQIRGLEQKASQVDLDSRHAGDTSGRLRELEGACEDLRRRLAEERQVKDNFQDLLGALKSELEKSHNERDNLRDEIVPQLRARVEGLEAQAAEHEQRTYENTKMQQEMQALRSENLTLAHARREQQMSKFNSITEESAATTTTTTTASPRAAAGVTRSNSVAQGSGFTRTSRPPSLARAASVKGGESREVLAERVKDIEHQRDALHRALKSLLERQEYQNRENQKRIQQLEMERDRVLQNSPRRQGYHQEVKNLRAEINALRRRAEEAIEQKWQCEKGLSGLKMDLERAEQEIGSLRSLLHRHDLPAPDGVRPGQAPGPGERARRGSASSEALEQAYRDLRRAYAGSLARVQQLEASGPQDAETAQAMAALEQSLSAAIHDRDFARQEAEGYRLSAASLQAHAQAHVAAETHLADELRASAKRVEELATQVRQQLASNATLRQRLTETIDRGEKEQKANADRIVHMQGRLRGLEDALVAAQQASEERVQRHEEELSVLKESHSQQLLRVKDGLKSPRLFAPKSPLSPLFAGTRSPRLASTTSGPGVSVSEESRADFLKTRVIELERALEEADHEMQEVVGRMNVAQIEVMELQNEREESVRQTKRLQALIDAERLRGFEEKFKTLSS